MKFKYKISKEELQKVFNGLLELDESEYAYEEEQSEFFSLERGRQDRDEVVEVNISTLQHAMILLDYLSYDNSSWDFEPRLKINFPNKSFITYNRRGNYGHATALEKGDYLIICNEVKAALQSGAIKGQPRSVADYAKQVDSLITTISNQAEHIKRLEQELEGYKQMHRPKSNTKDLPF